MNKRRKHRDNPYNIGYDEKGYWVEFKDIKGIQYKVNISKELFDVFERFELDDLRELNEYDRHTEHFDLSDEQIYIRSKLSNNVERTAENNIFSDSLFKAIKSLSNIQKRRIIKYFFDGKNEYEIAKEENTTHQSVHISLERAKEKLKEILKNFKN